jgi:hypothetical protein
LNAQKSTDQCQEKSAGRKKKKVTSASEKKVEKRTDDEHVEKVLARFRANAERHPNKAGIFGHGHLQRNSSGDDDENPTDHLKNRIKNRK